MATRSAAEARLDAAIRPEIAVLRSRTSYPERYRAARPGRAAAGPQLRLVPAQRTQDRLVSHGASAHTPASAQPPIARTAGRISRTAGRELPRGRADLAPAGAGDGAAAGPVRRPGGAERALAGQGGVRLTRRGRVVVAMLGLFAALAVSMLAWLAVAGQAHASSHVQPGRPPLPGVERVVVRPGDTLWSIAVRAQPAADPRAVIAQITEVNALASPAIHAGEVLWVPAG